MRQPTRMSYKVIPVSLKIRCISYGNQNLGLPSCLLHGRLHLLPISVPSKSIANPSYLWLHILAIQYSYLRQQSSVQEEIDCIPRGLGVREADVHGNIMSFDIGVLGVWECGSIRGYNAIIINAQHLSAA